MSKITKGRLTRAVKNEIVYAVQQELLKLHKPIAKREHDLALEILKDDAKGHWEQLNTLPPEFINSTLSLYFSLTNDERTELQTRLGSDGHISYSQYLHLNDYYPGAAHACRSLSGLTAEQKDAFKQLIIDRIAVEKEEQKAILELNALMARAKNVQELIKLWPDVEDYLPEAPEPPKALPAVQTNTLDALLPVEEKKAA